LSFWNGWGVEEERKRRRRGAGGGRYPLLVSRNSFGGASGSGLDSSMDETEGASEDEVVEIWADEDRDLRRGIRPLFDEREIEQAPTLRTVSRGGGRRSLPSRKPLAISSGRAPFRLALASSILMLAAIMVGRNYGALLTKVPRELLDPKTVAFGRQVLPVTKVINEETGRELPSKGGHSSSLSLSPGDDQNVRFIGAVPDFQGSKIAEQSPVEITSPSLNVEHTDTVGDPPHNQHPVPIQTLSTTTLDVGARARDSREFKDGSLSAAPVDEKLETVSSSISQDTSAQTEKPTIRSPHETVEHAKAASEDADQIQRLAEEGGKEDVPMSERSTDRGVELHGDPSLSRDQEQHKSTQDSSLEDADLQVMTTGQKEDLIMEFRNGSMAPGDNVAREFSVVIDEFFSSSSPLACHPKYLKEDLRLPEVNSVVAHVVFRDGDVTITPPRTEDIGRFTRYPSLEFAMNAVAARYRVPDCEFLVQLHDGNKFRVATFGSARHWKTWINLIPAPMGNERGMNSGSGTSMADWDTYVTENFLKTHSFYPWHTKTAKAIFRGNFGMQTHTLGSCNLGSCRLAKNWKDVNRGALYVKSRERPDLLDVEFISKTDSIKGISPDVPIVPGSRIPLQDHQKFKLVVSVGSNQDWAERLRVLLHLNSAIVKHEAETLEFFYPLLKPYVHYIPMDLMMDNLTTQVEWAIAHDSAVQEIVSNANSFAARYLTTDRMLEYWYLAIRRFASVQKDVMEQKQIR